MKSESYSIKDLEVLSGIKAHTIRIWEKRYNLLNPNRTDTNIRFYTDEDLKRILNISLLTKSGYKISKVASWDKTKINKTIIEIDAGKISESNYIDRFLIAMINFDNVEFIKLLNKVLSGVEFEEAFLGIFFKLFERVGTYWQAGAIFPAQEHFVSNIFRQKLIAEIDRVYINNVKKSTMLFFLPENELHEIGLLFYSYLAQKAGYNVIYLGQDLPSDDLGKIQLKIEIDYIFTAFANPISKENLENYLVNLKDTFQQQKIFITGYQVQNHLPVLPRNFKVVKNFKEFRKFLG